MCRAKTAEPDSRAALLGVLVSGARRPRCRDDAASIAATTNIARFRSARGRVENLKAHGNECDGMTVLQVIKLSIDTLRTLRSDSFISSAGYITFVRTSDLSARDTGLRRRSPSPQRRNPDATTSSRQFLYVTSDRRLFRLMRACGTPPLTCVAPGACVASNNSAAFAGTVANDVHVTTHLQHTVFKRFARCALLVKSGPVTRSGTCMPLRILLCKFYVPLCTPYADDPPGTEGLTV